jgi:hypothetical protein
VRVIQSSSSEVQKAKRGLSKFLREEQGFVGVGVSLGPAGQPEIVVFVAETTSPVLAKVPTEWQGLAVRTEVTGFARKF